MAPTTTSPYTFVDFQGNPIRKTKCMMCLEFWYEGHFCGTGAKPYSQQPDK